MKWQKLDERPVWSGHYRRVVSKRFRTPDGAEHAFEVKDEDDSVAILALTEKREVLLVRQFRVGVEENLLELPGGAVDAGDTPTETAERELLEETGHTGALRHVGSLVDCAYSTKIKHAFVATSCRLVAPARLDTSEFIEVVQMPIDRFRHHLRSGRLTDVEVGYLGLDVLSLL